jgi:hypothetical protein|tara:strand:+ start:1277 stop:1675 length:399 start_codon:yes stop_codon:yes gene_type:complete
MTDSIGVLGSATTATAATTTVYTVPSAKASKVQVMYEIQGAGDGTTDFTITVNGIVVMTHSNITASNYLYSSPNALKEGPLAAQATGVDGDTTIAPAPSVYYLSAADTVTYTIGGTTAGSCNVQVVGVEIDV